MFGICFLSQETKDKNLLCAVFRDKNRGPRDHVDHKPIEEQRIGLKYNSHTAPEECLKKERFRNCFQQR